MIKTVMMAIRISGVHGWSNSHVFVDAHRNDDSDDSNGGGDSDEGP